MKVVRPELFWARHMPEVNYQKVNINVESIRKESQVYQLKPDDRLFEYHKAVNEACFS